jgi:hypothetical protein
LRGGILFFLGDKTMSKTANKYKLICSDNNFDRLIKNIDERWFCGPKKEYRLLGNNTYGIFFTDNSPKAGQQLSRLRIILKNGGFRFEKLDVKK